MVSIIIPVHNRLELLKETIESLQAQTCGDFEGLIVDDHSDEDISGYVGSLSDPRFKYFASEKRGANPARNLGLEQASGEFVAFLDSDDLYHPKRIQRQLEAFSNHPEADGIACYLAVFREHPGDEAKIVDSLEDERFLYRTVSLTFTLNTPSTLWRSSFIKDKAKWSEDARAFQDVEFHIRLLLDNPKIYVQKEIFGFVRLPSVGQNITRMPIGQYHETLFSMLERLHPVLKARGDTDPELRRAHLNAWCLCYRMLLHDGNRSRYLRARSFIVELAPIGSWRRFRLTSGLLGPIMVGQGLVFRALYGLGYLVKVRLPAERSIALRVTWIGAFLRRMGLETESPRLSPFLKIDSVPGLIDPK